MEIKIALAGNPNCGKTTLFNALTGANQFVGNWPGVTVEKKEGRLKGEKDVIITDLPGIYSLSPYTMEEVVKGDDKDAIDAKVEALSQASAPVAQKMYAEQAEAGQAAPGAEQAAGADDVVDAEFEEVKDNK